MTTPLHCRGRRRRPGLWALSIGAPGGAACKREPRERALGEVLACVDGQQLR